MTKYDSVARFRDAVGYENLASGHDFRAGLNESLAHAIGIPEAERILHAEIAVMHGQIAAKYRALGSVIQRAVD